MVGIVHPEVGMVGIVHPGIYHPVGTPWYTPPSQVHPVHTTLCTEHRYGRVQHTRVSREEALGSTLRLILTMRRIEASSSQRCETEREDDAQSYSGSPG